MTTQVSFEGKPEYPYKKRWSLGHIQVHAPDGTLWCHTEWASHEAARAFVQSFLDRCGPIRYRMKCEIIFKSGVRLNVHEDVPQWLRGGDFHLPVPYCDMADQFVGRRTQAREVVISGDKITLAAMCEQLGVDVRRARSKLRKNLKPRPKSWEWEATDPQLDEVRTMIEHL